MKPMKPAKLLNRFSAHIIDLFIIMGIWMTLTFLFMLSVKYVLSGEIEAMADELGATGDMPLFALLIVLFAILIFSVVFHAYFISMESRSGQTIGKKWMRIKVVSIDGSPITKKQAIHRDFVKVYFELLFTVPIVYIFINKNRQRLGDKWAKTLVIGIDQKEHVLK